MKKLFGALVLILIFVSGCQEKDAFVAGENDIIINAGSEWEYIIDHGGMIREI